MLGRPTRRPSRLHAAVIAGLFGLLAAPQWVRAHPDVDFLAQAIDQELAVHPDDAALILKQARLRERVKDWDGALLAIEHAREHGADPDTVAAARGRVFHAAGFPLRAKREYDHVLAHRPEAFELLFERGRVQLVLGRPDDADADFGRAIANMKAPRPEQIIERHDALLARGEKAQAVQALDEGIARLGSIISLELPAIDLDLELGRDDRALIRVDALLAQRPAHPGWMARRGEILARTGRSAEARAAFAGALERIEARTEERQSQAIRELEARLRMAMVSGDSDHQGEP